MTDDGSDDYDLDYLLDRLEHTTGELPDDLRRSILDVEPREDVVPGLIEILRDDSLRPSDVRDPSPPAHAAVLLGLRAGVDAVEPLLEVVTSEPTTSKLFNSASQALGTIGEPALEPTIERWHEADDRDVRDRLARTLGELRETGDERIVEVLIDELDRRDDPFDQTSWLVQLSRLSQGRAFEDAEIAGRLQSWFDERDLDPSNALDESLIASYEQTMERLGVDVSDEIPRDEDDGGAPSSIGPEGDLFQQGDQEKDEGKEELEKIHEDLFLDEEPELSDAGITVGMDDLRYDADEAPDSERWLEADDQGRIEAIRYHHRSLDDHPHVQNEEAHYALHAAIEELIAREVAGAAETCRRLVDDKGIDRHRALHAMARELFDVLNPIVQGGESLDEDDEAVIAERLRALGRSE
jgi:hypothetical protein